MTDQHFFHTTVLLNETVQHTLPTDDLLEYLKQNKTEIICILDATIGGAGHAKHLIKLFHDDKRYDKFQLQFIGIDQDRQALDASEQALNAMKTQYTRFEYKLLHMNFADFATLQKIHGCYADFGVSSPQLDQAVRGFSLLHDGPLDMRMNRENDFTAAKILLTYPEIELARIFYEFGEEPKSRILARAIVKDRNESKLPLENTKVFADYVKKILRYGYSRIHPATRIFQALRIEVNHELDSIQNFLTVLPNLISPFAHAGFISFHSLEDRLVKRTMRLWQEKNMGRENPRGGITPSEQEIAHNPRARSARLRVFNFLGTDHDTVV